MTLPNVQVGNPLKIILFVVTPDGLIKDMSTATGLKIKIKNVRSLAGKIIDAALETDGTDGAVSCQIATADIIDSMDVWKAQVYYTIGIYSYHTFPVELFTAEGNLA